MASESKKKVFFSLFFCFYNDFYAIQAQRNKDVPWDCSLFRSDALWFLKKKNNNFLFLRAGGQAGKTQSAR